VITPVFVSRLETDKLKVADSVLVAISNVLCLQYSILEAKRNALSLTAEKLEVRVTLTEADKNSMTHPACLDLAQSLFNYAERLYWEWRIEESARMYREAARVFVYLGETELTMKTYYRIALSELNLSKYVEHGTEGSNRSLKHLGNALEILDKIYTYFKRFKDRSTRLVKTSSPSIEQFLLYTSSLNVIAKTNAEIYTITQESQYFDEAIRKVAQARKAYDTLLIECDEVQNFAVKANVLVKRAKLEQEIAAYRGHFEGAVPQFTGVVEFYTEAVKLISESIRRDLTPATREHQIKELARAYKLMGELYMIDSKLYSAEQALWNLRLSEALHASYSEPLNPKATLRFEELKEKVSEHNQRKIRNRLAGLVTTDLHFPISPPDFQDEVDQSGKTTSSKPLEISPQKGGKL